jgi:hypothetical protein
MRTLLVGEGNFSFTRALVRLFNGNGFGLTATSYDTREICLAKYTDAAEIIQEVRSPSTPAHTIAGVGAGVDAGAGPRLSFCVALDCCERGGGVGSPLSLSLTHTFSASGAPPHRHACLNNRASRRPPLKAAKGPATCVACGDATVVGRLTRAAARDDPQVETAGAKVLFGVDAGALLASLKLAKKYKQGGNCLDHEDRFDRVVFNFPHTGLGIKVRSGTGWGSQAARADSRQHSTFPPEDVRASGRANTPSWVLRDAARPYYGTPLCPSLSPV